MPGGLTSGRGEGRTGETGLRVGAVWPLAVGRGGESSGAVLRLMGRGRMGLGRGRKGTVRICEVFCMRVDTVYRSHCFLRLALCFGADHVFLSRV